MGRHVGIKNVKCHVAFTNYTSLTVDIIYKVKSETLKKLDCIFSKNYSIFRYACVHLKHKTVNILRYHKFIQKSIFS